MRLQILSVFTFLATIADAQIRVKPTEMSAGLSIYKNLQPRQYTFGSLSNEVGKVLGPSEFTEQNWYNHQPQIREYHLGMARKKWHSDNYLRELTVGLRVVGQFQHRTLFIGTRESLEEEVQPEPGIRKQTYKFQTEVYSKISDWLFVTPNIEGKVHLNQRLNFTVTASLGIGAPVKSGHQVSSYNGMIYRTLEGDELVDEYIQGSGTVNFEWTKSDFSLAVSPKLSGRVEFKLFDMKPFFAFAGGSIGRQFHVGSGYNFGGYDLGLISLF